MSEEPVSVIEVLRPANPLSKPPSDPTRSISLIDELLLSLPEWKSCQEAHAEAHNRSESNEQPDLTAADPTEDPAKTKRCQNPQERIRHLSSSEQQRIARSGELGERVALERRYGKAVWESLLHNSRLTVPEVIRIARMGALPIKLLDLIVGNRTWLASPQVRRVLLLNRRLGKDMILSILRTMPKSELRLLKKQSAYPPMVREVAKNGLPYSD